MKPLGIDLYSGLGGWSEGLLAEGYRVLGFDIERHVYGEHRYPAQLVIQDVLTLHGSQFRDAALIVASPPCQGYSYRAMPWRRAKALPPPSNELFDACFRIQREACESAGRHVPMVVENVKGAQPWVGRAAWHFGSFYLWADIPSLMPITAHRKVPGMNFHQHAKTGAPGQSFQSAAVEHVKGSGSWFGVSHGKKLDCSGHPRKVHGFEAPQGSAIKNGKDWFGSGENCSLQRRASSGSNARKAASAQIAKIPFELARWIAHCYHPDRNSEAV